MSRPALGCSALLHVVSEPLAHSPMDGDSTPAIHLTEVSKYYPRRVKPLHTFFRTLFALPSNGLRTEYVLTALHPCNLQIQAGEVVGLVGRNGAGKSTLLQLVCGTLHPSAGQVRVLGKVGAILELGAGFNPEFTGRENIHLALAAAGATRSEFAVYTPQIIAFSGLGNFIEQPLKTFSSGMQVRLAFAVATVCSPSILVIDEALSVGDGEFARRSFDRILALKESGATILFCSHSLFHIEALCSRALWLEAGRIVMDDVPSRVLPAYQGFLDGGSLAMILASQENRATAEAATVLSAKTEAAKAQAVTAQAAPLRVHALGASVEGPAESAAHAAAPTEGAKGPVPHGAARLTRVRLASGAARHYGPGAVIPLRSGVDNLSIEAEFSSDPALPCPTIAVTLHTIDGRILSSAASWEDGIDASRCMLGRGSLAILFPRLPLLKGDFGVSVYLFCERGLHVYDRAERIASLNVTQTSVEQGFFSLERTWSTRSPFAYAPETVKTDETAETAANAAIAKTSETADTDAKRPVQIARTA